MTNAEKILHFLNNNDFSYCDDCLSELCKIKPRQQVNQICNNKITDKLITVNKKCHNCEKIKNTRQKLHIHSELQKEKNRPAVKDVQNYNLILTNKGNIHFNYNWTNVYKTDGRAYHFPENPGLIDKKYKGPSVYKWSILGKNGNDLKIAYIGETIELIRRVRHYCNPGPKQKTNVRIKDRFMEYLRTNRIINLEILIFDEIQLNEVTINSSNLLDSNLRKMLEHLFITIFKEEKYILLNKV